MKNHKQYTEDKICGKAGNLKELIFFKLKKQPTELFGFTINPIHDGLYWVSSRLGALGGAGGGKNHTSH